MKNIKKRYIFIENWNGHLFLAEKKVKSITTLYNHFNLPNKRLILPEPNNITNALNQIYSLYEEIQDNSTLNVNVIGDHSNSYPIIKYYKKLFSELQVVILDAHPDVEIPTDVPTHEDYLRVLIENKILEPKNIILIGIRTFTRGEYKYLADQNIKTIFINDFLKNKDLLYRELSKIELPIYLSLDIDVFDPDFAPGTYYKEWCGINLTEFCEIYNKIKSKVVGLDIAEYYEAEDKEEKTLKLIEKVINYL